VFNNLSDSINSAFDLITDFKKGEDLIDLSGLGFSAINSGVSSDSTSLNYSFENGDTIIKNSDNSFKITLSGIVNLTDSDFDF
jgi:hypothetical protein